MSGCVSSPLRTTPCVTRRLELRLFKCNQSVQASFSQAACQRCIVPSASSAVHEDSVDAPSTIEAVNLPDLKGDLPEKRSPSAQEEVQGPTCGVDDLTIWKLIYGPGATLSYTSDSEEETLEAHSQHTANFNRLMGGERMARSIAEED